MFVNFKSHSDFLFGNYSRCVKDCALTRLPPNGGTAYP